MFLRLAAALLVTATSAYAAHNVTVSINDTSIAYSGSVDSWKPYSNCGGTKYTFNVGQSFSFNFVGTGVYVVGTGSYSGGIITFNLDGVSSTFDRYDVSAVRCGVPFFGKGGLDSTSHTLMATLTGTSPENSTAQPYFEYQGILYTVMDPTDSLTTSSPILTSTTTSSSPSPVPTQPVPSKINAGALGGGIAAGVSGLLIIGFVIWFCVRRGNREKAAAIATQSNLEPPRQSFIDSPTGADGYGRFGHDGDPGERRRLTNIAHGEMTTASRGLDAQIAANLAPRSNPPVINYPYVTAAPSLVHSSSQLSGSLSAQTYSAGIPHNSTSGYTAQDPTSGTQTIVTETVQLPDSEVERIAARVASMVHQPAQLPPGARPPESRSPPPMQSIQESYEKPPPMYESKQDL